MILVIPGPNSVAGGAYAWVLGTRRARAVIPLSHQEAKSDQGFWTQDIPRSDPIHTAKISWVIGWVGPPCEWNKTGRVRLHWCMTWDWHWFNPAQFLGRIFGSANPGYVFETCSHEDRPRKIYRLHVCTEERTERMSPHRTWEQLP